MQQVYTKEIHSLPQFSLQVLNLKNHIFKAVKQHLFVHLEHTQRIFCVR